VAEFLLDLLTLCFWRNNAFRYSSSAGNNIPPGSRLASGFPRIDRQLLGANGTIGLAKVVPIFRQDPLLTYIKAASERRF